MTFQELHISSPILKALHDKQYLEPTPIQKQAIPVAIDGRDILGIAQTGTGKTAAFAIPILEHLKNNIANKHHHNILALILTPTRELAIQIEECFADYGKYLSLRHTVIFGGVNQNKQIAKLRQGVDILTATPGRLLDFIGQGIISLNDISLFVLDEADRMLDMGFIHDIRRILPLLPQHKQTMFFSATMPSEATAISKTLLHNPLRVEITPASSVVDTIEQHVCYVEKAQKINILVNLLNSEPNEHVLIFSRTKHGADKIARNLCKHHIQCGAIHGNKSQNARQKVLSDFKAGLTKIIVATDIAARGIDIKDLGIVINYDLPDIPETYVHRIGRTGRAGNSGVAFSFCTQEEYPMIKQIQKLTGKRLSQVSIPA
jgi:ATP-dependent RNA helicase RhlE